MGEIGRNIPKLALLLGIWLFYVWDFFLKNFFFPCGNKFLEMLFKYMCKSKTSSKKFECRTIWISWKIYKILKTVEFFNMWLFISKIKNLNFCICQKPHFCCSGLGQVSSWWINSNFCVGKVPNDTNFFWTIFFISYDPLEFSTGACPTPSGTEMVKTHHCALPGNGHGPFLIDFL